MSVLQGFSMRAPNPEKKSGFGKSVELQDPITYGKNPNGTYLFKGTCPETGNKVCAIKGAADGKKLVADNGYSAH